MRKNSRIFIDSSSLRTPKLEKFIKNKKLYVPLKAYGELKKDRSEQSLKNQELLKAAHENGQIVFVGEASDFSKDDLYESAFKSLLERFPVDFITQDEAQAKHLKATLTGTKNPLALYYLKNGILKEYRFKERPKKRLLEQPLEKILPKSSNYLSQGFEIASHLTSVQETPVSCEIPASGDTLYYTGGSITLGKKISSGAEGNIYETDTDLVAKIYKKERINKRQLKKLERMITLKIDYPGICYPTDLLKNAKNETVGFLMPKARGTELQSSVFIKKLFIKKFPDWDRHDLVQLCLTILSKINFLNSHGIIMGDINPMNILVVSPTEVYFVDTDSYQIEDFPCPMGTVNFSAPEIQGISFSTFLRNLYHEYFAIATLMFMILLPGKAPYSKRGGEGPAQNIKSMDFSYPYLDNYNGKTPKGPWGYIWSNLPDALQEAFYKSFKKGERYAHPQNRLSGTDWEVLFTAYLGLLEDPGYLKENPHALTLFPKHYRPSDRSVWKVPKKEPEKKPEPEKAEKPKREAKRPSRTPRRSTRYTQKPDLKVYGYDKIKKPEPETKTLICRKCRRSFPDYEMKAGLCPECRKSEAVPKSTFEKKQEKRELICRNCRKSFKASLMQGGLCPDCRKKLGIPDHAPPKMSVSGEKSPFVRIQKSVPAEPKMLICRSCHREVPDDQMKNGLCAECRGKANTRCKACGRSFPSHLLRGGLCSDCRKRAYESPASRERMLRCERCKKSYPASELVGGLCVECRGSEPTAWKGRKPEPSWLDKKKEATKEAIDHFFKDVPKDKINQVLSWLVNQK